MQTKYLQIAAISIFLFIGACSKQEIHDVHGDVVELSNFEGKWLVINYWADWCPPCLEEIPELNAFNKIHKELDAVVIGVHFDLPPQDQLENLVEKLDIKYLTVIEDIGLSYKVPVPEVLPVTYITNLDGTKHTILIRPQTKASLEAAIAALG